MITQEQIRKRLVEAIKQSGMTQQALAEKTGVCQQSISQYLSGRAMPALDTFANLCVALDANADEILGTK